MANRGCIDAPFLVDSNDRPSECPVQAFSNVCFVRGSRVGLNSSLPNREPAPQGGHFLQTIPLPRNHFGQMLDSRKDTLAFYTDSTLSLSFLALILPAARGCNFHTEQNTNWGRKMCCSPEKIGGHCRRSTESPDRVIILITAAEVGAKQGVDHSWVSSEATAFHGRSFVRAMQPPL